MAARAVQLEAALLVHGLGLIPVGQVTGLAASIQSGELGRLTTAMAEIAVRLQVGTSQGKCAQTVIEFGGAESSGRVAQGAVARERSAGVIGIRCIVRVLLVAAGALGIHVRETR